MLEIEIKNLPQLIETLKKYPAISARWFQRAIEAGIAEVQKTAVKGIVPWKTGRLTQSFGEGIVIKKLWAKIGPTVNYAIYVHEGTAPHIITPKNKKALFWEGATHPVKSVRHPGTKPNRFMDKITERAYPRIQKHFTIALEEIVKEIAKL